MFMDDLVERPHISTLTLPTPYLVRYGDSATLTVEVSGFPTPSVRWYIGRELVRDSGRYQAKHDGYFYSLYIEAVTEEISRGVFVVATNQGGEDRQKVDIKIYKVLSGRRYREPGKLQSYKSSESVLIHRRRRLRVDEPPQNKSFASFGDFSFDDDTPWQRLNKSAGEALNIETDFYSSTTKSHDSGFTDVNKSSPGEKKRFSSTDDVFDELESPKIPVVTGDFDSSLAPTMDVDQSLSLQKKRRKKRSSSAGEARHSSSRHSSSMDTSGMDLSYAETTEEPMWAISGVKMSCLCKDILGDYKYVEVDDHVQDSLARGSRGRESAGRDSLGRDSLGKVSFGAPNEHSTSLDTSHASQALDMSIREQCADIGLPPRSQNSSVRKKTKRKSDARAGGPAFVDNSFGSDAGSLPQSPIREPISPQQEASIVHVHGGFLQSPESLRDEPNPVFVEYDRLPSQSSPFAREASGRTKKKKKKVSDSQPNLVTNTSFTVAGSTVSPIAVNSTLDRSSMEYNDEQSLGSMETTPVHRNASTPSSTSEKPKRRKKKALSESHPSLLTTSSMSMEPGQTPTFPPATGSPQHALPQAGLNGDTNETPSAFVFTEYQCEPGQLSPITNEDTAQKLKKKKKKKMSESQPSLTNDNSFSLPIGARYAQQDMSSLETDEHAAKLPDSQAVSSPPVFEEYRTEPGSVSLSTMDAKVERGRKKKKKKISESQPNLAATNASFSLAPDLGQPTPIAQQEMFMSELQGETTSESMQLSQDYSNTSYSMNGFYQNDPLKTSPLIENSPPEKPSSIKKKKKKVSDSHPSLAVNTSFASETGVVLHTDYAGPHNEDAFTPGARMQMSSHYPSISPPKILDYDQEPLRTSSMKRGEMHDIGLPPKPTKVGKKKRIKSSTLQPSPTSKAAPGKQIGIARSHNDLSRQDSSQFSPNINDQYSMSLSCVKPDLNDSALSTTLTEDQSLLSMSMQTTHSSIEMAPADLSASLSPAGKKIRKVRRKKKSDSQPDLAHSTATLENEITGLQRTSSGRFIETDLDAYELSLASRDGVKTDSTMVISDIYERGSVYKADVSGMMAYGDQSSVSLRNFSGQVGYSLYNERYIPDNSAFLRNKTKTVYEQSDLGEHVYDEVPAASPVYDEVPADNPVYDQVPAASPVYDQVPAASPVYDQVPAASPVYDQAPAASPVYDQEPAGGDSFPAEAQGGPVQFIPNDHHPGSQIPHNQLDHNLIEPQVTSPKKKGKRVKKKKVKQLADDQTMPTILSPTEITSTVVTDVVEHYGNNDMDTRSGIPNGHVTYLEEIPHSTEHLSETTPQHQTITVELSQGEVLADVSELSVYANADEGMVYTKDEHEINDELITLEDLVESNDKLKAVTQQTQLLTPHDNLELIYQKDEPNIPFNDSNSTLDETQTTSDEPFSPSRHSLPRTPSQEEFFPSFIKIDTDKKERKKKKKPKTPKDANALQTSPTTNQTFAEDVFLDDGKIAELQDSLQYVSSNEDKPSGYFADESCNVSLEHSRGQNESLENEIPSISRFEDSFNDQRHTIIVKGVPSREASLDLEQLPVIETQENMQHYKPAEQDDTAASEVTDHSFESERPTRAVTKGRQWTNPSQCRSQDNLNLHIEMFQTQDYGTGDFTYNQMEVSEEDVFQRRLRTKSVDNITMLGLRESRAKEREEEDRILKERSKSADCLAEGRLTRLGRRTLTQELLLTKTTTREEVTLIPKSWGNSTKASAKAGGKEHTLKRDDTAEKLLTKAIKETVSPPKDEGSRQFIDGVMIVEVYDDSGREKTEQKKGSKRVLPKVPPSRTTETTAGNLNIKTSTTVTTVTEVTTTENSIDYPTFAGHSAPREIAMLKDLKDDEMEGSDPEFADQLEFIDDDIPVSPCKEGTAPLATNDEDDYEDDFGESDEEYEEEESDQDEAPQNTKEIENDQMDKIKPVVLQEDGEVEVKPKPELVKESEFQEKMIELQDEEMELFQVVNNKDSSLELTEAIKDVLIEAELEPAKPTPQPKRSSADTGASSTSTTGQYITIITIRDEAVTHECQATSAASDTKEVDKTVLPKVYPIKNDVTFTVVDEDTEVKTKKAKPAPPAGKDLPYVDPNSIVVYEYGEMISLYSEIPDTIGAVELAQAQRQGAKMQLEERLHDLANRSPSQENLLEAEDTEADPMQRALGKLREKYSLPPSPEHKLKSEPGGADVSPKGVFFYKEEHPVEHFEQVGDVNQTVIAHTSETSSIERMELVSPSGEGVLQSISKSEAGSSSKQGTPSYDFFEADGHSNGDVSQIKQKPPVAKKPSLKPSGKPEVKKKPDWLKQGKLLDDSLPVPVPKSQPVPASSNSGKPLLKAPTSLTGVQKDSPTSIKPMTSAAVADSQQAHAGKIVIRIPSRSSTNDACQVNELTLNSGQTFHQKSDINQNIKQMPEIQDCSSSTALNGSTSDAQVPHSPRPPIVLGTHPLYSGVPKKHEVRDEDIQELVDSYEDESENLDFQDIVEANKGANVLGQLDQEQRPRSGSQGSTDSEESVSTSVSMESNDTVIDATLPEEVNDHAAAREVIKEQEFPSESEVEHCASGDQPTAAGTETPFHPSMLSFEMCGDDVIVKVVTSPDGQIQNINIVDEDDEDHSSLSSRGSPRHNQSGYLFDIDEGEAEAPSERLSPGHSLEDASEEQQVEKTQRSNPEISAHQHNGENSASANASTPAGPQSPNELKDESGCSGTVAEPDVRPRTQHEKQPRDSGPHVDTDVFAEKAFVQSLLSTLGTMIFLLLAAIIFYLINNYVERDM